MCTGESAPDGEHDPGRVGGGLGVGELAERDDLAPPLLDAVAPGDAEVEEAVGHVDGDLLGPQDAHLVDAGVGDAGAVGDVGGTVDGQVGVLEELHGGAFERALGQDEAEHGGRSSQTRRRGRAGSGAGRASWAVPPPYDARNFLQLLGIDVPLPDEDRDPVARLTVTHAADRRHGFLWAPVVIAMADALCAFGVSHHWPEGASSFTTVDCSANFISSAREGEQVAATAAPLHLGRTTQVWDATVTNETTERLMASYRCTQIILY